MKRLVKSILFVIFILLCSANVFAVPQIGHQFYGYAVDADTTITATVGGVDFETISDSDGYYGYNDIFFVGASSDEDDGGDDGDDITFSISGVELGIYSYEIAGVTELNFDEEFGYEGGGVTVSDTCTDDECADGYVCSDSVCEEEDNDDDDNDNNSDDDDDNDNNSDDDDDSSNSSSSEYEIPCHYEWDCQEWEDCESNGFQTRVCYYEGTCADEDSDEDRPDTRQACDYVAPEVEVDEEPTESCYDGIQNQGERDVDCGGPCSSCPEEPVLEEPGFNWMYLVLAILIILLIAGIILAHYYKDGKLQAWWNKMHGKKGGKTETGTPVKKASAPLYPNKPATQQQQVYRRPQYIPRIPAKPTYKVPLKKQ
jgi:hypothetical protein